MGLRIISLGLLVFSLFCYLEWGGNNSGFLFQMEYSIFFERKGADSFLHPLVLMPLAGQLLLLISIIYRNPKKRLALIGMLLMSVLILMVLLAGLLSVNLKIIGSTLPFVLTSTYFISRYKHIH